MATLGLCIICHERPDELATALASAEGKGFDEIVVLDMASAPPLVPVPGVTWLRSEDNVGVAIGRNQLTAAATAEVLVFLDDDAVLCSAVGQLRSSFDGDPALGCVAFRIVRRGGATEPAEHPFRGRPRDVEEARPCAYFVGAGYAVRRRAVEAVGGYDQEFFYSTEEVELSLRLASAGWRIRYEPSVVVEHRPSSRGRSVAPRVPALRMRNRTIMARRHLPLPVAIVHVAAWAARTLLEARHAPGGLATWRRAAVEGFRVPVQRRPLSYHLLLALHRRGGRVLW